MVEKKVTKKAETATPKAVAIKPVAPKAEAVKPAAPKAEAVKPVAPKAEAVKAEPVKKEAVKEEPAKKETVKKAPAKKAPVKKAALKQAMYIEFAGKSYTQEDLVKIAKDVWKFDLKKKVSDFKSVELYVKPEESIVYYVINEEEKGSFYI